MDEDTQERAGGPVRVGGRYELGELLGRGGMAEVRKATDVRLGRAVAVKRLRTDLAADPTFQTRFRREAQSAAGLNHPNIVAVYDTGEEVSPDGAVVQPYIVMEYVAGRSLRDVLNDGRKVLPERALEIMQGILAALDYSHRAGIIHRDIKPGNVMLTPSGEVKVMDFGIARAISDATSSVTQTAAVVGTAQYLSPEQARGESVDSRSDVYSAGCLLYELLAGRPPFLGDSPFSIAYQHVRETAAPPSAYNPDVPPELDAIVLKALAKRVEDRYQSAADMQRDIQRYLDGHPVDAPTTVVAAAPAAAPPPGPATLFGDVAAPEPEEERRRGPMVVLLLLLLALLVGGLAAAWALFGNDEPRQVSVPSVRNMTLKAATERLREEGLELGEVNRESSDVVPKGRIIDQDPAARETVEEGTEVDVTVSAGEETVVVPDVIGQSEEQATAVLEGEGFDVEVEEEASSEPEGTVVDTDPRPAAEVAPGSTVTIFVSTGAVAIPDVVGLTERQARARLDAAGFDVAVEYDADTPAERGIVLSQDPTGEAPPGTTVTIVVSDYEEPEPTPTPSDTPTSTPTTTPSPTASTTSGLGEPSPSASPTEEESAQVSSDGAPAARAYRISAGPS